MRCFLVCITVLFFSGRITGQTPELPAIYSFDYTKVIPGMPENASLGAYGNISLNTAKGLPDIHVDLYTISKGGVNIPISISYLASGIKYDDIPSSVGMHWQLNAGGSINRSVNGYADEDYLYENLTSLDPLKFNYQNSRINSHPTQDSCKFVAKNYYDFSLDYYFYNFPGHSGSMYPSKNKTFFADKEYSRLQIKAGTHLDNFTIKDDAGNTYVFGTYTDNSTIYNTGKYNKQASSSFSARVAWKLLTIITATQQRINFEYVSYSYNYYTLDSEKGVIYINNGGQFDCPNATTYNVGNNAASFQTTQYVNTASLLSKIYTDDQEVLFQYVTNTSVPVFQKKLSGIKVYSKISGDTIKNISLSFTGDYLDSVKETDKSALSVSKKYSFKYNSYYTPDSYSKSRDIFGYNNGMTANNSLMDNPAFKSYFPYAISNRDVNAYFASYGILNEITYPTGGKTTLTYESNKEDIGGTSYYSPGLRVKSILEKDITNKIYNKKNFYYSQLQGG